MRCDCESFIASIGQDTFGSKAELKNLNSFNFVCRGLAFEEVPVKKKSYYWWNALNQEHGRSMNNRCNDF